ncbi:divalent-cation tolerance protein CutA [Streptomyces olivoverticillatus]|nr:divalent-cation tolerance protein CutA [Streptomyces olivoverticillatus]
MPDADHLLVMTTIDSEERARRLAGTVIDHRLAACAQIDGPLSSVYRWQGEAGTATEWRILFKTTADRYAALEAHLTREHTYDVPEIVATPVTAGSDAYLGWLRAQTRDE